MAADERWKRIALIIEAQDAGVDIETVADNPEWAAQARDRNGHRAREFVAIFDALNAPTPIASDEGSTL